MKIVEKSFEDFVLEYGEKEGLVLLGCGGDLIEWPNGVAQLLADEGIISGPEVFEEEVIQLVTTGKRTDLALIFSNKGNAEIGRMAIWRIRYGECSWVSDYIPNYANHHDYALNSIVDEDDE